MKIKNIREGMILIDDIRKNIFIVRELADTYLVLTNQDETVCRFIHLIPDTYNNELELFMDQDNDLCINLSKED